ncbi:chitinase-like protein 4 [Haemaphysalis longicornis]
MSYSFGTNQPTTKERLACHESCPPDPLTSEEPTIPLQMLSTHTKRKRHPVACSSCGDTLKATSTSTCDQYTTTSDTSRSRTATTAATPGHATFCSLCDSYYTQSAVHWSTGATKDSRSVQGLRAQELDSDVLPPRSSRSEQDASQQRSGRDGELATCEDNWTTHADALCEALQSHRPRLRILPQWQSRGGQVLECTCRNKSNLLTSSLAVSALLLLLPLGLLYYKAGTVAADMPQPGRFLAASGLLGDLDGRSLRGFNVGACADFHPLVDSESRRPDLRFLDTEDFIPYRTESVSRNAIFCVYQNDAYRRFPNLRYRVVDVPGAYCTHVIYHAAGVTADGSIYSKDPIFDETYQCFRRASELKATYPHLKILLSLGGGPDERDTFQFSKAARDLNSSRAFADKAYWWLVNQGFDGLHLDWHQPAGTCGTRFDKRNFVVLVATLRERFGGRYVITAGVPYQDQWRHRGYHLPGLADQVDFLLATTHGFSDAHQLYTQCPSPYGTPPDSGPTMYDVIRTLKHEVPRRHRHRLCFSVSLQGNQWTLRSPGAFHVGSPARAAAPVEYPLVCKILLRDSVDPDGLCSYAVRSRKWIAYEGPRSLTLKLERMRQDVGTPGLCLAVWDLAFDDFKGDCGNSRSPLMKTIYSSLSATRVWVYPRDPKW